MGGGYNPSILYTIQMASNASKMVAVQAELDEERRQQQLARKRCKHRKHFKHWHGRHDRRRKDARDTSDSSSNSSSDSDSDSNSDSEAEAVRYHERRAHCGGGGHKHHAHHPTHPEGPFTNRKLKTSTLLYLATLGGAHVCSLDTRIGSLVPGKAFDALHVTLSDVAGNPAVWGKGVDEKELVPVKENVERWLERFLFGGDNRNLKRVWVQGVVVGGTDKQLDARTVSDESEA